MTFVSAVTDAAKAMGRALVATPERLQEFKRRITSSKAWGIDSVLLTPDEAVELVPYMDKDVIVGAFYTPSGSVVDSLRAGTIMRERAQEMGALQSFANVEVLDLVVENVIYASPKVDITDRVLKALER